MSFHTLQETYRSHSEFKSSLTFPDRNLTDSRRRKVKADSLRVFEAKTLIRLMMRLSYLSAHPLPDGWLNEPGREEWWFLDWQDSSAGVLPLGRHWFLETHDYVDDGIRNIGFVPRPIIWPRQTIQAKRKPAARLMESNSVHAMHEVCIHGRGGQGAVMACSILAQALIDERKYVVAIPSFGFECRGAPVAAFLRFADISYRGGRHKLKCP